MGLWDSVSNILSGGARNDADQGYNEANAAMNPYMQGGAQDYQSYRNSVQQQGQSIAPYANAGNWQAGQINQSPADYYNQIMQGYSESPQAKYEQQQAMNAANAGGSASGMLGSGAYQKAIQQNAADISSRDQQQYFGNVMGANQMQMGYTADLRDRQNQFNQMQQYLAGIGYGAAGGVGQNDINRGLANAGYDQGAANDIAGGAAMGAQNYNNNWMSQAGNDASGLPWYMMFA